MNIYIKCNIFMYNYLLFLSINVSTSINKDIFVNRQIIFAILDTYYEFKEDFKLMILENKSKIKQNFQFRELIKVNLKNDFRIKYT